MGDPFYADGLMVTKAGVKIERPTANDIELYMSVQSVIRSYQQRGHLVADLDPLGIVQSPVVNQLGVDRRANELVLRVYDRSITAADMERELMLPSITYIGGKAKSMKLK